MHTRLISTLACTIAVVGTAFIATPAFAAPEAPRTPASSSPGVVVAQDLRSMLTAKASAPGSITVSTAPRTRISVVPDGRNERTAAQPVNTVTDATGSAIITSLTPGVTYSVLTADAMTRVTVLGRAGEARALTVTTTERPEEVRLTWNFTAPRGSGAAPRFRVEARPDNPSFPTLVDQVTRTSATVAGLDPELRYTFRVTPFNELGDGSPTSARMTRSLAQITGRSVALEAPVLPSAPTGQPPVAPVVSPTPTPEPAPAQSPGSSSAPTPPAPAPATPRTRTIYVCPEGFSESGGSCRKTSAYTFSTRSYTYTYGKTGTETFTDTCSSGYTDASGQFHWVEQPHPCQRTRDVYGNIKDATPTGWTDTGSNWSKKDDAPAGWSDDGSQYVQTAEKIAREVPA
jgi:hypothetical protein